MKSFLLLLTILAVELSAQTHPAMVKGAPAHQRTTVNARPATSDAEIERTIRAKFAASTRSAKQIHGPRPGRRCDPGRHANVVQHKGTATRLAKNGGAIKVVNKIELSQAARDKASQNLAQGRRRAQRKRGESRSNQ